MSRVERVFAKAPDEAKTRIMIVVPSAAVVFASGILALFVSVYFSLLSVAAAAVSCVLYLVAENRSARRAAESSIALAEDKARASAEAASSSITPVRAESDGVIAALREKTEKANKEFLSYFVGEKVNFDRISAECNAIAEKNEAVTSRIRAINHSFATENKVVKDLVKNIADNVDKEISASRGTLTRLERLFSFINEIIRVSGLLRTNSEFLMSLMQSLEDISEQIHILSINASIIASRSGEAGKAFMVVAKDERILSDNVKKSVQNMKENSRRLARSIEEVMSNINQIDAETKTTHDAIDNLIMRFEGLNLSVNIIERKIDANTNILNDIGSLIDQSLEIAKSAYNLPEKVSLENTEEMRAAIMKLLDELIHA